MNKRMIDRTKKRWMKEWLTGLKKGNERKIDKTQKCEWNDAWQDTKMWMNGWLTGHKKINEWKIDRT